MQRVYREQSANPEAQLRVARHSANVERWRETSVSTHADARGTFSLCDSERIKLPSLNRMNDLSSHSKVVRARCVTIGTELQ